MHIAEGDSTTGFRIGGAPPVGVCPKFVNEGTQYFGTFPISGDKAEEMSIFCSLNCDDPEDPCFVTRQINQALGPEIIECVFHHPARRAIRSGFRSELQGYPVKFGKEAMQDPADPSAGPPHQIGGIPFLEYDHPRARKASADLLQMGYLYLMRWTFPGSGDCLVKGEWPFHNFTFHLYLKITGQGYDCRALLV